MRHNIILTLSLACALLLDSCQKEISLEPKQQEFVATLPSALTRTTVTNDGKVSWESTDAIGIFDENVATPVKATIKSISDDGKTAVFTPAADITKAVGAIYPYDANAAMSDNSTISISLGATRSGDFSDANIAAAKSDGYNLAFKNVTAVFKFNVSEEEAKSIKITAPKIAGTLGITLGSTITATLDETDATDEITVSNITPGTDYYIAIASKQYDDISFSWFDNSGEQLGIATLGKSFTASLNSMYTWNDLKDHEDIVAFSDANFKAYCVENFDKDGDGEISMDEAEMVESITVDGADVKSLKGIEYFTKLKSLDCSLKWSSGRTDNDGKWHYYDSNGIEVFSQLSSLDVSKNTALTRLHCNDNQLSNLDVSKNTALTDLGCGNNQLSNLDVSKNTALTDLSCNNNQLSSLDVSKNTALNFLNSSYNQLTSLDVGKNTALTWLYCNDNQLSSLDVSKNTALTRLHCNDNQLSNLDVSKNTALTDLYCDNNQLTNLDVSKNTALNFLYCNDNQLSSLDVSKNTALTWLYCNDNQLSTLDVSKNTALNFLNSSYNQLTSLDVSKNTALIYLNSSYNQLTSLDVSKNTALIYLNCSYNQLSTIYVWEGFDTSKLTISMDASASFVVKTDKVPFEDANFKAYCVENFDTDCDGEISIEEAEKVESISAGACGIKSLKGIEYFTALTFLDCNSNQLTSLDVSSATALFMLICGDNQLTSLDISNNAALFMLDCGNNQLTSLDVSNNTALFALYCYNNRLTTLDISNNTTLGNLNCEGNQITSIFVWKGFDSTKYPFQKDASAQYVEVE